MLHAYQSIPAKELFTLQQVQLTSTLEKLISNPNRKVLCEIFGEEIISGRKLIRDGLALCRSYAGNSYYAVILPQKLQKEISIKFDHKCTHQIQLQPVLRCRYRVRNRPR